MSDKAIVLLSGGIDSATCLYWTKSMNYDLYALTLNYYDRWRKEIEATKELCKMANVKELIEIDVPFIKEAFNVLGYKGDYIKDNDKRWPFYIPAKNFMFYSMAAHFAEYMSARWIVGGHNKHDVQFFTDATTDYLGTLNRLLREGCMLCDGVNYEIVLPLVNMDRLEVIQLALKLKVPLEVTWSCHVKTEKHCGQCYGCTSRKEAFNTLGIKDPTEYNQ